MNEIRPDYYNKNTIEAIDVIQAWELNFCLGNTVKYIARNGKKDPTKKIVDLKKALWYLDREIELLERIEDGKRAASEANFVDPA